MLAPPADDVLVVLGRANCTLARREALKDVNADEELSISITAASNLAVIYTLYSEEDAFIFVMASVNLELI